MIRQGNRKLYTAEEKNTYLQMFKEQDSKDFARFAQSCEVPIPQFRLWLQQSELGQELKDSKPLSHGLIKRGNGKDRPRKAKKAEHPASEPYYADELTKTYWAQQMLRARVDGGNRVPALQEVFVKATGFTEGTIGSWTRDYLTTPKGKKFNQKLQPKPVPKAKKVMPGRPAHTRYLNPETGTPETKLHPQYWNKLVTLIGALDMDLRSLDQKLSTQTKRLDELLELWR